MNFFFTFYCYRYLCNVHQIKSEFYKAFLTNQQISTEGQPLGNQVRYYCQLILKFHQSHYTTSIVQSNLVIPNFEHRVSFAKDLIHHCFDRYNYNIWYIAFTHTLAFRWSINQATTLKNKLALIVIEEESVVKIC